MGADSLESRLPGLKGTERLNALEQLTSMYCNLGITDKAMSYARQHMVAALQSKDTLCIAAAYNSLASVYHAKLDWDLALQNYLIAYRLFDAKKNLSGLALIEGNIGNVYREMRRFDKAIEYLSAALEMRKKLGDEEMIATAEVGLGAVYYDINEFEKSIAQFESAMKYFVKVNDRSRIALLLNNIGSIRNEQKKYSEAIENYTRAMELYSELGDSSSFSMCIANIGNVYNESGRTTEGIEYASRSIEISKRIGDKNVTASAYTFLIEGLLAMKDYKRVAEAQAELISLKDTIYDLETSQSIAEMQTRFDTEKKAKENEILKQQNELQSLSLNRQRIINYSVSGGLILVLILAFYIWRSYREKQRANILLERKQVEIVGKNNALRTANRIIQEKNKDITDSIRYAKRLQSAILKPENGIRECFGDGFVFFRPKDIVSGDFYWFERFGDQALVAAADCTGHGVPGAFMSIIGCNLLSQSVNEYAITQPAAILNSVNKGLSKVLQQKGDSAAVSDGMDIALCSFDRKKMIVEYAGAYNPVWLVRDGKCNEYKGDKFPVGAFLDNQVRIFRNHEIPVQPGDWLYLFSDGYADQFGGPEGKKFKYKQFSKLFTDHSHLTGEEQKDILSRRFEQWIGDLEQVDDLLVIGIRI
jgi:serine phosphatase RsbU (regulator of sigma subunit)